MKGRRPAPIEVRSRERAVLERIARSQAKEYRMVQRANMIIAMAEGANNKEVAQRNKSTRNSVRVWRQRWIAANQRLAAAETERELGNIIEDILSDEYRSGTPPTFTPEQIVQIVAISCEKPEESERPISHWTPRELAEEAIKRQIVASISTRSAGRFLKGDGITATSSRLLANTEKSRS